MLLIDTVLRLLAAGQLLLIALVVGLGKAPAPIRIVTALLLLDVAAYLANAAPVIDARRSALWPMIQLCSQSAPVLLWLFAHLIFERAIPRRILAGSVVVTLLCWAAILHAVYVTRDPPDVASLAQQILSFALASHAIWIAINQRGDDLIERRRAFRTGFVVVVGIQTLGVVLTEAILGHDSVSWLLVLQSGTTFLAVCAFGAVLLSSNAELLFDPNVATAPTPNLSPAENVLRAKLDAAIAEGVHREPGLSIGTLAARLGVPEHRLRALINQRLGYRNFSAFLNAHRVGDARAWLGDAERVSLPVLTIAMDLGYGSLAPFNRAFREITGQTPTEWRRAALAGFDES